MNPYSPDFNYFTMDNGLGWIRPSGVWTYDYRTSSVILNTFPANEEQKAKREGKAYLQRVFQEYMDY